jgi:hypothetical protein
MSDLESDVERPPRLNLIAHLDSQCMISYLFSIVTIYISISCTVCESNVVKI